MKLPAIELSDMRIFWAGAITMYGYPIVAWLLLKFFAPSIDFKEVLLNGEPYIIQFGVGVLYACITYFFIHVFIFSKAIEELTKPILVLSKKLNWVQIVFLSLAAGVGEEILFRGAIQYFIGIWPTSVLFIALHGYLSVSNLKIFLYGLFMVVVSAGFGYLYREYGMIAAITAHFIIDLLIFSVFKLTSPEKLL